MDFVNDISASVRQTFELVRSQQQRSNLSATLFGQPTTTNQADRRRIRLPHSTSSGFEDDQDDEAGAGGHDTEINLHRGSRQLSLQPISHQRPPRFSPRSKDQTTLFNPTYNFRIGHDKSDPASQLDKYAGRADEYMMRTLRSPFSLAHANFLENVRPAAEIQGRWIPTGNVPTTNAPAADYVREEHLEAIRLAAEKLRSGDSAITRDTFSTLFHKKFGQTREMTTEVAARTLLQALDEKEGIRHPSMRLAHQKNAMALFRNDDGRPAWNARRPPSPPVYHKPTCSPAPQLSGTQGTEAELIQKLTARGGGGTVATAKPDGTQQQQTINPERVHCRSSTSNSRTYEKLHNYSDVTSGRSHEYFRKTLRTRFTLAKKNFISNLPEPPALPSPKRKSRSPTNFLGRSYSSNLSSSTGSPAKEKETPAPPPVLSAVELLRMAPQCKWDRCVAYIGGSDAVNDPPFRPEVHSHPSVGPTHNLAATFQRLRKDDRDQFYERLANAYYSKLDTKSVKGSRFPKRPRPKTPPSREVINYSYSPLTGTSPVGSTAGTDRVGLD